MTVRVVIADSQPLVRSGIRAELAHHVDIEMIDEAIDGNEATQKCEDLFPNVLVMDIQIPGLKAIEVIQRLGALSQPVPVLILTDYHDMANAHKMLEAGAKGYLLKDEEPDILAEAIQAVAEGKTWLSDEVEQWWVQHTIEEAQIPKENKLSEREMKVLQLLAKGYSNSQIAETLAITEGTVKNHLVSIYGKLGVHKRIEAMTWAWQHGMKHED
jgi:DNA-binding NarL/FixJ family response regulator